MRSFFQFTYFLSTGAKERTESLSYANEATNIEKDANQVVLQQQKNDCNVAHKVDFKTQSEDYCHSCFSQMHVDKTDCASECNETEQSFKNQKEKSLERSSSKCNACLQPTCKTCTSPSVLAKVISIYVFICLLTGLKLMQLCYAF